MKRIIVLITIIATFGLISAEPTLKIFHSNGTLLTYNSTKGWNGTFNNTEIDEEGFLIVTEVKPKIELYVHGRYVGSHDGYSYIWRRNKGIQHITNFQSGYYGYRKAVDLYNKQNNRTVLWIMNKPSPYCSKCFSLWYVNYKDVGGGLTDFWEIYYGKELT